MHDECTTFHTTSPGTLAALKQALAKESVPIVADGSHRTGTPP